MKERGRRDLVLPLGVALAHSWCALIEAEVLPERFAAIPAPSRASATRRRGIDVVGRLTAEAADLVTRGGLAHVEVTPRLCMTRGVRDSVGLSPAQRQANLAGRIRTLRAGPKNLSAVIVDDVLTTGATVSQAAETMIVAGTAIVAITVLAHA